jgi:hypothetical protein
MLLQAAGGCLTARTSYVTAEREDRKTFHPVMSSFNSRLPLQPMLRLTRGFMETLTVASQRHGGRFPNRAFCLLVAITVESLPAGILLY